MIQRVLLTILLHFYRDLIIIDPNVGNEMGKDRSDAVHQKGNQTSHILITLLNLSAITVLELLSLFKLHYHLSYFDWLMFAFATVGVILCYWAYWSLGRLYTFTIGIRNSHTLVSSGPYRYLVHPGYVGQYMVLTGCLMFYNVYLTPTILFLIYMAYVYIRRMIAEERMLAERFGNEYTTFMSERWRFFSFVVDLLK